LTEQVAASIEELGWDDAREAEFAPFRADGLVPGRVAIEHKIAYVLMTGAGETWAELPGRLRHEGVKPAVGDWVAIQPIDGGRAQVQAVLERRTKFSRKTLQTAEEQVLATNVDVVFLLQALTSDLNVRRLERYLTMGWESGATPVVVLTKSDVCDDVQGLVEIVEAVALGVPVHPISNVTGEGLDDVRAYLHGNRTAALLGSSGVGKSTLVNRLMGEEVLATQELRADGKGRHTTSHRQLLLVPGGGIVIDTPGMRELQLWESETGLEETFDDVESLAAGCRFSDCKHEHEPGCAVTAALLDGSLAPERMESYRKLQRELRALQLKTDARARAEQRREYRIRERAMRKKP